MSDFPSLVDALRRRKVRCPWTGQVAAFQNTDFAIPSFSFETIFDGTVAKPPALLSFMQSLADEAETLMNADQWKLPFPRCAYILPSASAGVVTIMIVRERPFPACMGQWLFRFEAGQWLHIRSSAVPASAPMHVQMAVASSFNDARVCTMLIVRNHTANDGTEEPPTLASVNAGRAKGGLSPLPATIRLKWGEGRQSTRSVATGNGGPKCPHDRRGHWRTNPRTGQKDIWVQKCSIHSGNVRNYTVQIATEEAANA